MSTDASGAGNHQRGRCQKLLRQTIRDYELESVTSDCRWIAKLPRPARKFCHYYNLFHLGSTNRLPLVCRLGLQGRECRMRDRFEAVRTQTADLCRRLGIDAAPVSGVQPFPQEVALEKSLLLLGTLRELSARAAQSAAALNELNDQREANKQPFRELVEEATAIQRRLTADPEYQRLSSECGREIVRIEALVKPIEARWMQATPEEREARNALRMQESQVRARFNAGREEICRRLKIPGTDPREKLTKLLEVFKRSVQSRGMRDHWDEPALAAQCHEHWRNARDLGAKNLPDMPTAATMTAREAESCTHKLLASLTADPAWPNGGQAPGEPPAKGPAARAPDDPIWRWMRARIREIEKNVQWDQCGEFALYPRAVRKFCHSYHLDHLIVRGVIPWHRIPVKCEPERLERFHKYQMQTDEFCASVQVSSQPIMELQAGKSEKAIERVPAVMVTLRQIFNRWKKQCRERLIDELQRVSNVLVADPQVIREKLLEWRPALNIYQVNRLAFGGCLGKPRQRVFGVRREYADTREGYGMTERWLIVNHAANKAPFELKAWGYFVAAAPITSAMADRIIEYLQSWEASAGGNAGTTTAASSISGKALPDKLAAVQRAKEACSKS